MVLVLLFSGLLRGRRDQIDKIEPKRLAYGLDVVEREGHLVPEPVGDVAR